MTSRDRLKQVLAGRKGVAPPRYESEFAPEVVTAWREYGAIRYGELRREFGQELVLEAKQ